MLVALAIAAVISLPVSPANADVFISTAFEGSVLRYDDTGQFTQTIASLGLGNAQGLAFGLDNNLYAGSGFSIVNGMFVQGVLRFNGATGDFIDNPVVTLPLSVSALTFGPDNNLYIAAGNNSVFRYDPTTNSLTQFVRPDANGGLLNPTYMVFGPDNNLYVTSLGAKSVMRYDGSTGAPLPGPNGDPNTAQFVSLSSGFPFGLTFGPDGNFYLVQQVQVNPQLSASRVLQYDPMGNLILPFIDFPSGLVSGADLAFPPDGNLYVLDSAANAILRYNAATGTLDVFARVPAGQVGLPIYMTFTP